MKITYKNVLMSLIAVGLLAGCSTKEVEYDGSSSDNKKADTITDTSVDNKFEQMADSTESVVEGDVTSSNEELSQSNSNDTYTSDSSSSNLDGVNSVDSSIDGQTITLSSIHFAFDKFKLTTNMREVATQNATTIDGTIASYDNLKIKLEGNCDEWGTDEYNYALGLKRAKASKDALIADGIDEDRIMLVSFGESNPVCTDRNVNCWKMNRRVDYRLLP